MSRVPQVCRDFQRGSCRYGSRCKFLHDISQQRQPSNPFGFGLKTQSQQQPASNKGGNYYAPLSGLTSPQRQQQSESQLQSKEHKCSDPRVCKQQIKEDLQNEHPVFWRLTSYAHWKYLPNDITGDISFEELRAHSYDSGKQGVPFGNVVQNERTMFNAKNTEFQNLVNNPYKSPSSTNIGFQSSGTFSRSLLAPSDASKSIFGKAASDSLSSPFAVSNQHASSSPDSRGSFGIGFGKETTGFSFGLGTSSAPTNAFSLSGNQDSAPFSSLTSSPIGFSFGTQSSRHAAPLVGTEMMSPQSAFGSNPVSPPKFWQNTSQVSKGFSNSAPHNNTPFQAAKDNTMANSFPNVPSSQETMNIELPVAETSSGDATSPVLSGQQGEEAAAEIWLKEKWVIGQVPEDEPPVYAR